MKEHVHPGEVRRHGEGREVLVVLNIDGRATFHGHVEHVDVVVDDHDVSNRAPVGVGKVAVPTLKV